MKVLSFLKLNGRCKQSQKNWFKTLQSGCERLWSSSPTQPASQRDGREPVGEPEKHLQTRERNLTTEGVLMD